MDIPLTSAQESSPPPRHIDVPDRIRMVKRRIPKPLKRMARTALRHYGLRTAPHRVLPDFLIIGTKRGGTTSLWNWLVSHEFVAPMFPAAQQIKSPHYFDIHYDQGLDWYRSHFPTQRTLSRLKERLGVRPLCGEASPYYVFHPLVAHRVHEVLPQVRLLVSLRNPVDRAYSHYWERRGGNLEPLATFEAAIEAEQQRLAGEQEKILADPHYYSAAHDCFSYLARGRYLEQLQQWFALYDKAQILIVLAEHLSDRDAVRQAETYQQVQRFLGLPVRSTPPATRYHRLPVAPMLPETRERLVDYYRPLNAALAEFLGIALPWDS